MIKIIYIIKALKSVSNIIVNLKFSTHLSNVKHLKFQLTLNFFFFILGWGRTENAFRSEVLKYTSLTVMGNSKCDVLYKR